MTIYIRGQFIDDDDDDNDIETIDDDIQLFPLFLCCCQEFWTDGRTDTVDYRDA